jgi:hypothetical protein
MSGLIRLFNGKNFRASAPNLRDVDVESFAHSIAQLPRFLGHQKRFVSVAEHSVLVAMVVGTELHRPDLGREALMHDLHECVSGGDIPTPYKKLPQFQGLVAFEKQMAEIVRTALGLPLELSEPVKRADSILLSTEVLANMNGSVEEFALEHEPTTLFKLQFWDSETAEKRFLETLEFIYSYPTSDWPKRMLQKNPELLSERITKRPQVSEPRYDDVFWRGIDWLSED